MTIDPIVERAQHLEEPVESELHRDAVNESILGLEPADGDLSPEAELEQTRAVAGPDAEVLTVGRLGVVGRRFGGRTRQRRPQRVAIDLSDDLVASRYSSTPPSA